MNSKYHIIIVGGGLAGLAAAKTLSQYNLNIMIIDENVHIGGQFLRKMTEVMSNIGLTEAHRLKKIGRKLIKYLDCHKIKILDRSEVLGIYPGMRLFVKDRTDRILELNSEFVICATGAREKYLPFKGWTLPGVISTGAAQVMIKGSHVLPAKKILIGGCGPIPYALAGEINSIGGQVLAILDQTLPTQKIRLMSLWRHHLPKIFDGANYLLKLLLSNTKIRQGVRIIEVKKKPLGIEVITSEVDQREPTISTNKTVYQTETLAVGYGLTPNIELPQQAGCKLIFKREKGGAAVEVDCHMETSVKNIFAVGETTGIGGAKKSYIEGYIAALSILNRLELIKDKAFQDKIIILKRHQQKENQYGHFLNKICHIPANNYYSIDDEAIICRCENITMRTIRNQMANGFKNVIGLKNATRCGMGSCQGRICGPIIHDILRAYTRQSSIEIGLLSAQFPVKPVKVGALAALDYY